MQLYLHHKEMSRVKRIFKRALIVLASVIGLLALAVFIVLRFYEDEVVSYVIKGLNDRLKTKASVASVDLTFWETFPKASVKFTDVYVEETFREKDTLLFARKIYLEFALTDLFRGHYRIDRISSENGKVFLKVNQKGEDNWHFLRESPTDSSSLSLDLEELEFTDVHIVYEDRKSRFFLDYSIATSGFSGAFQSGDFDLRMTVNGRMHRLISGYDEYMADREVVVDGDLQIEGTQRRYSARVLRLRIDQIPFRLNGYVKAGDPSFVDVELAGDDLTMKSVLNILPAGYKDKIAEYEADGVVTFSGNIRGKAGGKYRPDIQASFEVSDGNIEHKNTGTSFEHLSLKGSFVQGAKQDQLSFEQFSGQLQGGNISGSGVISQLSHPQADLRLRSDIGLNDLQRFLNWDTLEVCEGRLVAELSYKGALASAGRADFSTIRAEGKAEVTGAKLKLKHSNRLFTDVGATVRFNNRDAHVEQFKGQVNGSDFVVTGTLNNLLPFLVNQQEKLHVEATLKSHQIDFGQLLETPEDQDENYEFNLPENITFLLNSRVEKFVFEKFTAEGINGIVQYNGRQLDVDPVSFTTSEGSFLSQMRIQRQPDDGYYLICSANFKGINIQKMFASFGNFGQEFITDKHLRGKARATVQLETPMSKALKFDMDKLHVLMDVGIDNGELIGLESLQEIGKYMKSNKWIAPFVNEDAFMERMRHIRFSQLENVIEIRNRKIILPNMFIKSSALDISVHGDHGFDNVIDYTFGFRLRDVLIRKTASHEMDDGLGKQMYIYMRGTTTKPTFGVDKEAAKEERQEEIAREKNNVKALLKEEFGLFKKDQGIGPYVEQPLRKESVTTIEWEELDDKDKAEKGEKEEERHKLEDASDTKKEKKEDKKLPRWLRDRE